MTRDVMIPKRPQSPPARRGAARRAARCRRGATLVETAIVLGIFLLVLLGTLDVGLAGLRQNALSDAARRVGRQVALRGAMAPTGAWGPQTVSGVASDGSGVAEVLCPWLATMQPGETTYRVEWIDGGNQPGQRVRITLSYDHRVLIPSLSSTGGRSLQAVSVLPIAH